MTVPMPPVTVGLHLSHGIHAGPGSELTLMAKMHFLNQLDPMVLSQAPSVALDYPTAFLP